MDSMRFRWMAAACAAVAIAAMCTAGAGVFLRGDGATRWVTSVRGERYEMATTGVYANNAERVVAEGIGWDLVTLVLAAPALLLAVPAVARGSLRGRLFAVGMLGYFFYQYLMYAIFWALGPLFPVFIVVYAGAAATLTWVVSSIDIGGLPQVVSARFPRRGMAVFSVLVALMLVAMWAQRIAVGLSGDLEGANLLGVTTLSVQAMDLGMVVPFALATAALVWRGRAWGYVLAPVLAVKGVAMAAAICAMVLVAGAVEGALEVAPLAMFAVVTVASGWLALRMFRDLAGRPAL